MPPNTAFNRTRRVRLLAFGSRLGGAPVNLIVRRHHGYEYALAGVFPSQSDRPSSHCRARFPHRCGHGRGRFEAHSLVMPERDRGHWGSASFTHDALPPHRMVAWSIRHCCFDPCFSCGAVCTVATIRPVSAKICHRSCRLTRRSTRTLLGGATRRPSSRRLASFVGRQDLAMCSFDPEQTFEYRLTEEPGSLSATPYGPLAVLREN